MIRDKSHSKGCKRINGIFSQSRVLRVVPACQWADMVTGDAGRHGPRSHAQPSATDKTWTMCFLLFMFWVITWPIYDCFVKLVETLPVQSQSESPGVEETCDQTWKNGETCKKLEAWGKMTFSHSWHGEAAMAFLRYKPPSPSQALQLLVGVGPWSDSKCTKTVPVKVWCSF